MSNRIIRISLIVLGLVLYSGISYARGHVFEVALEQVQMEIKHDDGTRFRAIPNALLGKYAYRFNQYVAVEGVFGLGLSTDDYVLKPTVKESLNVDSVFSAGAVAYYPISKTVSIFANLGYSNLKVTITRAGDFNRSDKLSGSGPSYGAGFLFDFTPTESIIIKYGYLPDVDLKDGGTIQSNTVDIGYQKRF